MALENTHYGAACIKEMLRNCRNIYFLGIGGINMSSLAHITHTRGYRVGGSDRTLSKLTERLAGEGIEIFEGHDGKNISSYDALVYTVAVSSDNPEYLCAKERGIPCISRADYMGYIMTEYKTRIGISGMHGKSTCTSMCAEVLMAADTDPTVLSGAELASMDGAWRIGKKENFLFEACEYMDSFLDFNPNIAVILNIEMDHVDYFKSMEQIRESYGRFASIAGKHGACVVNADDGDVMEAVKNFEGKRITFGINSKNADIRAENIRIENGRYCFSILKYGEVYCNAELCVTGYHNIYNALATAAVAYLCGLDGKAVAKGLSAFRGAKRRMEYKGEYNGASLYDDYAHHPTEVRATLKGAKEMTRGRLFCVFQSHTYSRTSALFDDFADALRIADKVIVAKIYAAREVNTFGVSEEKLAEAVGNGAVAAESFSCAAELLKRELRENDVAIVMGAGDVWHVFDHIKTEK